MSLTEEDREREGSQAISAEQRARELAAALFDEVVAPLARQRQAAGAQAYFPLRGDVDEASYYAAPTVHAMQAADFEFPGGGTPQGLIDAVAELWKREGEAGLASMAPKLKAIAEALERQVLDSDGSVSIFCYTMF